MIDMGIYYQLTNRASVPRFQINNPVFDFATQVLMDPAEITPLTGYADWVFGPGAPLKGV